MPGPFVKLADPSRYVAATWDLATDPVGRRYWVDLFKRNLRTMLRHGVEAAAARGEPTDRAAARADACAAELDATFDGFFHEPAGRGRVTILTLDRWRDRILHRHGFEDPFVDLKSRENERMLPLVPEVCRQIDVLSGREQVRAVIEGVFAGNIFDMGSEATAKAFAAGEGPGFFATRAGLPSRPWLIDDYDALEARLLGSPAYRLCAYFIDNAGSDFLLGAVPMMRWLAMRGTRVLMVANERPTLNDMTVHDVRSWWPRVVETEASLRGLPIEIVSSGTGEPLIDLLEVSDELNAAAADADLVVLEGMGRGIESNLEAEFACDAVHLAMVKDPAVAERVGGKVFDVVCRYKARGSAS